MGLAILNLVLAVINGLMAYKNNENKNYNTSLLNGFACGFCLCASIAIFLK